MNNCHRELAWLVNRRLKPVNIPIKRTIILGPYLSTAQPPKIAKTPTSTILVDKIAEVAVRVKLNSLSMDLKKTPKERCIPHRVILIIKKTTTTTQP
jgi:hypothetical protein|tara:strand:- start:238 stop:528 length:291 start_codon:yes stop_codon:yes gene_type:complete